MLRAWIATVVLICSSSGGFAQTVVINMGTMAPHGSPWHQILQQMGEEWRVRSHGAVTLRIYAGGVQGDEPDMVKKMRIGQLQAAAISGQGLRDIEPAVSGLQIPMMFESYEELDYVRDRLGPRLEKMFDAKGYVVLNWGDAGWVYFFTKTPASRLSDIRKMKLFVWAGDNYELQLYEGAGFRAVPLAATDILTGLQTGLIDSYDTVPLMALSNQWFGLSRYMIDVKWAPLVGATVVSKSAWNRIPEQYREDLMRSAHIAGERMRGEVRQAGDAAVIAMQKRGLKVTEPDAAALADWHREAESVYPKLRGKSVPAEIFDEVQRLRDEFRAKARRT
jgi:TRAP-type C4-dicarboxylate transport system substrate-binding protein